MTESKIKAINNTSTAAESKQTWLQSTLVWSFQPLAALVCLLAALLAVVGQDILRSTNIFSTYPFITSPLDIGLLFSIVAGIIFGMAARKLPATCLPVQVEIAKVEHFSARRLIWLKLAAFACILMSVYLFLTSNYLYYIGYVSRLNPQLGRLEWGLSWIAFCLGMLLLARYERRGVPREVSPPFTRRSKLVFAGILLLGLILRCYDLIDIPHEINGDLSNAMLWAYARQEPSRWIEIGGGGFGNAQIAILFFQISTWILGPGILASRAPEVVLGTLMIVAGYLFVWRAFDSHRLAALTAFLMAVHAPLVHFSRHVMNIDPWTFALFGLFFLVHGLRSKRLWALGVAGGLLGFSLQLYISIRSLILTAPLIALYLAAHRPALLKKLCIGWVLFMLGCLVSIGPNITDLQVNQMAWEASNRTSTSFLNVDTLSERMQIHGFKKIPAFALFQLKHALLMFQVSKDISARMPGSKTLFSPLLAPFLWLGFGVSCFAWARNPATAILLLVIGVNFGLGQLFFPYAIPYWPRMIIVMFAGCLFIAIGLQRTCEAAADLAIWATRPMKIQSEKLLPMLRLPTYAIILALITVSASAELGEYYTKAKIPTSGQSIIGRYVLSLPPDVMACSRVDQHAFHVNNINIKFCGYGRRMKDFKALPLSEEASLCGPRPFIWLLSPAQADLRDRLQSLYPEGKLESHTFNKDLVFWSYYLP